MVKILLILQVVFSLLLAVFILLQARGGGLGSAFGGSATITHTRRGVDKLLFNLTIFLSFLFLLISLLNVAVG